MLARPQRGASATSGGLRALVVLWAAAALAACASGGGGAPAGPLPQFSAFEGREVKEVEFSGELQVPEDSLHAVVTTHPSTCKLLFIPICPFGIGDTDYHLDLEVLARDVVRVQLFYRDQGYYGTRVTPSVTDAGEGKVAVRFAILPGDLVRLTALEIDGTEAAVPEEELVERVPLKVGEPFRRIDFVASVDTVRNALLEEGHAYAQVLRNYQIDTIADVAQVQLQAVPGPVVTVDSIIFVGNYRLTQRTALHSLSFREGQRLRSTELVRSQRNLYDLELVDYATVEVAPESLQVTPDSLELDRDSIGSTVLVRIVEAPRYAVDLSAGYGTLDCFRGQASHTDRNFLGGARRLEVSGLISKVGVGTPLDAGFEDSLCREFNLDNQPTRVDTLIAQAINYRLAADFLQPRWFGTRTSIGASAYTERISELGLYARTALGGQVGVIRQVAPFTVFSTTFTVERGSTQATDFFFCVAYEVCRREDIDVLKEPRWSNFLSLGLLRNRVRLDPFPSGGYQVRLGTDYASSFIGSEDEYLRVLGDGSVYRELREDWVLQLRLTGGTFLEGVVGDGFIPPQRRFYAGGATTVRGYRRNQLGPLVYIRRVRPDEGDDDEKPDVDLVASGTGGTGMVVGTAELTAPSPFFRDNLRLAAFVDAGRVWSSDTLTSDPSLRFTPGAGLRYASPVGPLRADLAYNPYGCVPGPLFKITENGSLEGPLDTTFVPTRRRVCTRRLTLHLSIGTAF